MLEFFCQNILINVVDNFCSLVPFIQNTSVASSKPNPTMKNKLNLRKRLLTRLNITKDLLTKDRITQFNVEIKNHFYSQKRNEIRRALILGNNKILWESVKRAKDLNCKKIPDKITLNDALININDLLL